VNEMKLGYLKFQGFTGPGAIEEKPNASDTSCLLRYNA